VSSVEPPEPPLIGAPPLGRPIAWQVAASVAVHSAVLLLLVWPALRGPLEAAPPPVIDVELVLPSSEPSSAEPSSAEPLSAEPSEEGSSEEPTATEQSSVPAASSQGATSEPASAEASSSEPSAPEQQPSAAASSAEEPSSSAPAQDTPQPVAPVPMSRPIVIGIGTTGDVATDISSVEPDGAGELTADTGDAPSGESATTSGGTINGQAVELGELHVAQNFYLAQILDSTAMANARAALDGLPHDKRVSQTCNIEAIGQVANAGKGFNPDAVIIDAFSKSTISGTRLTAAGAIFRSEQKWYALAFDCTLNDDLTEVAAFTFRLGPDVTSLVTGSGSQ
jgi:hypothetical protein